MRARAEEEIGCLWSFGILSFTLGNKTRRKVRHGIGLVLSGAMCLGLRVFVARHMVQALRFTLAMALGVRDNTSCTSGHREGLGFSRFGRNGRQERV